MIRVGPAGWCYKDWSGIVYPVSKPRGFDPLAYISEYFDTIEINVTFYRPIPPETAEDWIRKIENNRDFRFTAKLLRTLTHERNATLEEERQVREGFAPLMEAGRLGAVLLQFPWSFKNTAENREYVARLRARFAEYPLVLEVRHASWNDPRILDFLEQLDLGLCNIDQPLFHRSLKPAAEVTSAVGYIRLHGRNWKNWFSENAAPHERYDYLYSVDQLDPWIERIQAVAHRASDTYAVTNNHYLGKATVNALEISSILRGKPVKAPATLVARYPELKEFTC